MQFLEQGKTVIFKALLYLGLDKVVRAVLAFSMTILLATFLTETDYAAVSYWMTMSGLWSILVLLGSHEVMQKLLNTYQLSRPRVITTTFLIINLSAAFSSLLFIAFFMNFEVEFSQSTLIIVSCFNFFVIIHRSIEQIYIFDKKPESYSKIMITSFCFGFLIKAMILIFKLPFELLACSVFLDCFIGLIILYSKENTFSIELRGFFQAASLILKESWYYILIGLLSYLYAKIDIFMLAELSSAEALASYVLVSKIVEGFFFIPVIVLSVLFGVISRIGGISKYLRQRLYAFLLFVMSILSIFVSLTLVIIGIPIFELFFPNNFFLAQEIYNLYCSIFIFVFISIFWSKFFLVANLQIYTLLMTVIGLLVNIVLNFLLIPEYGAYGATLATLFTYAFVAFFIPLLYRDARAIIIALVTYSYSINNYRLIKKHLEQIQRLSK